MRCCRFGQGSPDPAVCRRRATAICWHYSEFGEFVDFDAGRRVFDGEFRPDGAQAGLVALGGVRFAGQPGQRGLRGPVSQGRRAARQPVRGTANRPGRMDVSGHRRTSVLTGRDRVPTATHDDPLAGAARVGYHCRRLIRAFLCRLALGRGADPGRPRALRRRGPRLVVRVAAPDQRPAGGAERHAEQAPRAVLRHAWPRWAP